MTKPRKRIKAHLNQQDLHKWTVISLAGLDPICSINNFLKDLQLKRIQIIIITILKTWNDLGNKD